MFISVLIAVKKPGISENARAFTIDQTLEDSCSFTARFQIAEESKTKAGLRQTLAVASHFAIPRWS